MMKNLLFFTGLLFIFSCNNSSKKTAGQAMDDTARYRPPVNVEEIVPSRLMEKDIQGLSFKGQLQDAYKWTDRLGENILITSFVQPFKESKPNEMGEESQSAELYAYLYVKAGNDYSVNWTMKDGVKDCPFDITNNYIKDATTVTDLDKDGIAEIKIQYLTACRSDVSPAEMKLVMVENRQEYKLEGLSWLAYSPDLKFDVTEKNANLETLAGYKEDDYEKSFGRYKTERSFLNASPAFLPYARSEWMKFVKEKMPE